jgi:hypothetical protein
MLARILVFAALLLPACERPDLAVRQDEITTIETPPQSIAITDRVWLRTDSTAAPGTLRIFLSNGTLLIDSCWETYRLSEWRQSPDSVVTWREDTSQIEARILAVSADSLTLRLLLSSGPSDEHYRPASAPWVCPDMPRQAH